jgi:hypothetical protein
MKRIEVNLQTGVRKDVDLTDEEIAQLPVAQPPAVPSEVTMRQARLALAAAGKLAAVDAAIASLPEPQKSAAQIEWEYSAAVRRTQPLVLALAPAIGLTSEQLDALFIQAAAL